MTYTETCGEGSLLGRDSRSEVILTRELREALGQINPDCTANEINLAIDECFHRCPPAAHFALVSSLSIVLDGPLVCGDQTGSHCTNQFSINA